jgi:hypothetical protein
VYFLLYLPPKRRSQREIVQKRHFNERGAYARDVRFVIESLNACLHTFFRYAGRPHCFISRAPQVIVFNDDHLMAFDGQLLQQVMVLMWALV